MSFITEYIVPLSSRGESLGRAFAELQSDRPLPEDTSILDQLISILYHTVQFLKMRPSEETWKKIELLMDAEDRVKKELGITHLKVRFLSAEAARIHKLFSF